jgi:hypothetical protein
MDNKAQKTSRSAQRKFGAGEQRTEENCKQKSYANQGSNAFLNEKKGTDTSSS